MYADVVQMRPEMPWLERLKNLRGVFLRQNVDWKDVVLDQDIDGNKYQIKPVPEEYLECDGPLSSHDYKVLPLEFVAVEHSQVCCRFFCGPYRSFEMSLNDPGGEELLRIKRELKWPPHVFCGLFPLCGCFIVPQEAEVFTPEGFKLGSIIESHHNCVCAPSWFMDIRDAEGATRFIAKAWIGQCGPNCCCQDFTFEILTPQLDETGGMIKNVWPGCNFRGLFSRADNLTVTFPEEATKEDKALILGAAFLADYVFFEKTNFNKVRPDHGVNRPLIGSS